jgi:hypothetical protein
MRRLRPEGVCIGGFKALAWLGLLLGAALALASCATHSANEAYGAAVRIEAKRAERESGGIPSAAAHQPSDATDEPMRGSSASASRGQVSAFLSGLLGAPPQPSSAEEDAVIARAIAEHEMRKP